METQETLNSSYDVIYFLGIALPGQYRNLLYSKWLRSLRHGNDYFKLIDSDAYYRTYRMYITAILSKPGTMVKLAVLTSNNDVVLGFSVLESSKLHYVHVHKDMRRMGIGTSLVPVDQINQITHVTKMGLMLWPTKLAEGTKFDPF